MTKTERLKLAKAARELASLYAEGRGPTITNGGGWCSCAAGEVAKRAMGWDGLDASMRWPMISALDALVDASLTYATDREGYLPGAVVFPLLWLADELEAR